MRDLYAGGWLIQQGEGERYPGAALKRGAFPKVRCAVVAGSDHVDTVRGRGLECSKHPFQRRIEPLSGMHAVEEELALALLEALPDAKPKLPGRLHERLALLGAAKYSVGGWAWVRLLEQLIEFDVQHRVMHERGRVEEKEGARSRSGQLDEAHGGRCRRLGLVVLRLTRHQVRQLGPVVSNIVEHDVLGKVEAAGREYTLPGLLCALRSCGHMPKVPLAHHPGDPTMLAQPAR
mmetsp:Transcript_49672/g.111683  ORF Transcript_49672/g.111683 Transcript_49672/m.111683 type:complete len:234 (-) Transcript_49672:395-1096(-)